MIREKKSDLVFLQKLSDEIFHQIWRYILEFTQSMDSILGLNPWTQSMDF